MHGVMVGLRSERGVAQTIEVEEGVHGSHVSRPSYKMACLRFVQHPGEILKGVFVVLERSPLNFLCTFFFIFDKETKTKRHKTSKGSTRLRPREPKTYYDYFYLLSNYLFYFIMKVFFVRQFA